MIAWIMATILLFAVVGFFAYGIKEREREEANKTKAA
jgi:high-affinity Fe2+/Pb2+ permease